MKVIFLDVDGVLNSWNYYEEKRNELTGPVDPANIAVLKKIVESTGAILVLTSSWRGGWDPNPAMCQVEGQILNDALGREGMTLYAKTACLDVSDGTARSKEIRKWMKECPQKIEGYVIIDDADFGWKKHHLEKHWVQTDFMKSGLSQEHIDKAVQILESFDLSLFLRNIRL